MVMIKAILAVILLLLSGCTPATKMNVAKSEYLCKDHGGGYAIYQFSEYPIVCRDGTRFSVKQLDSVIITDHDYLPK